MPRHVRLGGIKDYVRSHIRSLRGRLTLGCGVGAGLLLEFTVLIALCLFCLSSELRSLGVFGAIGC